jgi:hypothetical protein
MWGKHKNVFAILSANVFCAFSELEDKRVFNLYSIEREPTVRYSPFPTAGLTGQTKQILHAKGI